MISRLFWPIVMLLGVACAVLLTRALSLRDPDAGLRVRWIRLD